VKPKAKESIIEEKQKAQRRRSQQVLLLGLQVIGEKKVEKQNSKFGQGFASDRKARICVAIIDDDQGDQQDEARATENTQLWHVKTRKLTQN
jgi:hypothetical protein